MTIPPWQETVLRVVIEFKKSNKGCTRKIELGHRQDVVPTQLQGRIHPQAWKLFMEEVEALRGYHPYIVTQHVGQCCMNLLALPMILCLGFGFCQPDGGHYGMWTREVNDCLAHHAPTFAQGGCRLSLHEVHGSHFIQVDVDPSVAVGAPVALPMAQPGPCEAFKPVAVAAALPPTQQAWTGAPVVPSGGYPPPYPSPQPQPAYGGGPPPGGQPYPHQYVPQQPASGAPAGYPSAPPPAGYPGAPPEGYPSAQYPPVK